MSFGRWLLVNSFSIFLVTLFILGYFYREELKLQQAYQQLLNIEPQKVLMPEIDPAPAAAPAAVQVENTDTQPDKIEKIPVTATLDEKPKLAQSSDNLVFVDNESPRVSQTNISTNQPQSQTTASKLNLDEILQLARQSYWEKEYSDSINLYQQLIDKDPENADLRGELGNIYYALNDYPNASNLYFQAAELLIAQNQQQRAHALVSPITAMNRELGARLSESLR